MLPPHLLYGVLAAVALVSQVLGQSLVAHALAGLPAAFSSVALLLQPTIAAALAWAILGEALGPGRRRAGRSCWPAWCWLGAAADGGRPSGGSEVRKMPEALVSEGLWEVIGPLLPAESPKPKVGGCGFLTGPRSKASSRS
jgi:hypothetical protein